MPARKCVGALSAVVLVVLAGGCGESEPNEAQARASASDSSSPSVDPPPSSSTSATPSATTSTAAQLSTMVRLTGQVMTHEGKERSAAQLAALGWSIDARRGIASWSDPALGNISVIWDPPLPVERDTIESRYGGDVIGNNLAMGPVGWYSDVFTTTAPTETSAHSMNGVRVDAPSQEAKFTIPEMPPGTTASFSIGLGFPVPVSVTYNYVYQ